MYDRTITDAAPLHIGVYDTPGAGGAQHRYEVTGFNTESNPSLFTVDAPADTLVIYFQNGPIKKSAGRNGVTQEVLLAIVADRLRSFQAGPYACQENADALAHTTAALDALNSRTQSREARGVEGTHAL